MDQQKVAAFIARYQDLDKFEIAELHAKQSLIEEARTALDAVIASRNIDIKTIREEVASEQEQVYVEQDQVRTGKALGHRTNFLDRAFAGQVPLWKIFWLGYIAPLVPLTIAASIFKETSASAPSWVSSAFFIVVFIYQAWLAVAAWRCAPNVKRRVFFSFGRMFAVWVGLVTIYSGLLFIKGSP